MHLRILYYGSFDGGTTRGADLEHALLDAA
jgi:hypothetical protein